MARHWVAAAELPRFAISRWRRRKRNSAIPKYASASSPRSFPFFWSARSAKRWRAISSLRAGFSRRRKLNPSGSSPELFLAKHSHQPRKTWREYSWPIARAPFRQPSACSCEPPKPKSIAASNWLWRKAWPSVRLPISARGSPRFLKSASRAGTTDAYRERIFRNARTGSLSRNRSDGHGLLRQLFHVFRNWTRRIHARKRRHLQTDGNRERYLHPGNRSALPLFAAGAL